MLATAYIEYASIIDCAVFEICNTLTAQRVSLDHDH